MNMNDGWFVKVLLFAGIAGAAIGMVIGFIVGTAFPEAYGSTSNPVGFGIAAGLAQGLVVGVLIGGFYVHWKTRLFCANAASQPVGQIGGSTRPKGAMSPLRTALIAFGAAAVLLVALGAYVFMELNRFHLRALPVDEGLRLSYYGSRPIMVVGFNDRGNYRGVYRIAKPIIYKHKSYGQVVTWSSIEPVNDQMDKPNKTTSRDWEVIYVSCQTAQR